MPENGGRGLRAWLDENIELLAAAPCCGYHAGQAAATEPTALAALALLHRGRVDAALPALAWLADRQNTDGALGVTAELAVPCWPTGLAVLAWTEFDSARPGADGISPFRACVRRATQWILSVAGETLDPGDVFAHDCTLIGWPWVRGTHSWIEPTAIQLLALKSVGLKQHPRAQEAAHLLVDRQLPDGGCNYGNTQVFGQVLRPHLQATGLALLALAGVVPIEGRTRKSILYLRRSISAATPPLSLGWALLGLAAHGRAPGPAEMDTMVQAACRREMHSDKSPHKLALLTLAGLEGRRLGETSR